MNRDQQKKRFFLFSLYPSASPLPFMNNAWTKDMNERSESTDKNAYLQYRWWNGLAAILEIGEWCEYNHVFWKWITTWKEPDHRVTRTGVVFGRFLATVAMPDTRFREARTLMSYLSYIQFRARFRVIHRDSANFNYYTLWMGFLGASWFYYYHCLHHILFNDLLMDKPPVANSDQLGHPFEIFVVF